MLINSSNLDALFINFSFNFREAYMSEPQPLLDAIGSRIPSNTRDQRYPFVQSLSLAMREWVGERRFNNVVLDGFTVTNKKWESSLDIQRTDVEDDQYGAYTGQLIPDLAYNAKLLPDREIASVISTNAVGFDGVAFFSASHPVDPSNLAATNPLTSSAVQSNALTTGALTAPNLAAAQAAMMSFVGPSGQPMGCMGDTILVPPSLKFTADTLANATFYPTAQNGTASIFGSQQNVWQSQYRVVVSPWIADTGNPATAVWYLLDCRRPNLRPFFWQEREAPQLISLVDPSNPIVFMQDIYVMGVRARGAAAASLWFKALRVTP